MNCSTSILCSSCIFCNFVNPEINFLQNNYRVVDWVLSIEYVFIMLPFNNSKVSLFIRSCCAMSEDVKWGHDPRSLLEHSNYIRINIVDNEGTKRRTVCGAQIFKWPYYNCFFASILTNNFSSINFPVRKTNGRGKIPTCIINIWMPVRHSIK